MGKLRNFSTRYKSLCVNAISIGLTLLCSTAPSIAAPLKLNQTPQFLTQSLPPLVMLTMARDHKLYYEAYNDYSDLDGDGSLDVGYKPSIEYYGYFDSYKCYDYTGGLFVPASISKTKKCSGKWSGDFLNYVTTARIDALRKVFYGGYRSTDSKSSTILERTFIPQDGHTWGKEYQSKTRDGYEISDYTPLSTPSSGKYHIFANVTLADASGTPGAPLLRVLTNTEYRVWEWVSIERPVAGTECATGKNIRDKCIGKVGALMDMAVRVEVCNSKIGLESNCQAYGSSNKPVGLLQKQGENDGIYFGLITGSYVHNTEGGVLRKPVSSITNEITADGRFGNPNEICLSKSPCVNGIISTINKLKITDFEYKKNYEYKCGWITDRQIKDGECEMWGNPIGEMVYEGMRYFNGKSNPTAAFSYASGDPKITDNKLELPQITKWDNPYSDTPNPKGSPATFATCAKPFTLIVSDVSPSFDSNSIPGSPFAQSFTGDLPMNFSAIGNTIWNTEIGGTKKVFIGEIAGTPPDSAPTAKNASSFGNIRGLAPSDPTGEGSYSAAAAAYYGRTNKLANTQDIRNKRKDDGQVMNTYSVALAAPIPKIEIPVGSDKITILPFAKSVDGKNPKYSVDPKGSFQPTNQIVDFYVDTIRNVTGSPLDQNINGGRAYYKFRVNFEDVEQGADYDMDAIATYEIKLNKDGTVSVSVSSDYAAASIVQHMGFVISGTQNDGAYLVVRDVDTDPKDDPIYQQLDCRSPDFNPATCKGGSGALPLYKELKFTPSNTPSAIMLNDPLWYAAKWGSFVEDSKNANNIPDVVSEWSAGGGKNKPAVPDNYYLVTNPLTLETQLNSALASIIAASGTAAATSASSTSVLTDAHLYQGNLDSGTWQGELNALKIKSDGTLNPTPTWKAQELLANATRQIITYDPDAKNGIPFQWTAIAGSATLSASLNKTYSNTVDNLGSDRVTYLRGGTVKDMRIRPYIPKTKITNKLGDIVNSQSQYVAAPNFGYGESSYAQFRTKYETRTPMLYVGANDGMLHGFSAVDGTEKIGYIPSEMYRTRNNQPLLSKLTDPSYGQQNNPHHFYVDGSPAVGDVCTTACAAGTDWKTILVGGLRAGGQGIYALDITEPNRFNESNAGAKNNSTPIVMWEFNDTQDKEPNLDPNLEFGLGYTFGRPSIVKICTKRDPNSSSIPQACSEGRWVVIFGNGYNNTEADGAASQSGHAILYVLDALTGAVIKRINTLAGTSTTPNGLGAVSPADLDGDGFVDYVYGGDLLGNLWKFDITNDDKSKWGIANKSGSNSTPLYIAKSDASSATQPITTAPEVVQHPNSGVMVLFGTGSFITADDNADTSLQSFYGIWDDMKSAVSSNDHSNLVLQAATDQGNYRAISSNTVDWSKKKGWYMNFKSSGERIASDPRIFGRALSFTSAVPSLDPCLPVGTSWDYFIDVLTGGKLNYDVFVVNSNDLGARKTGVGVTVGGTILTSGKGNGVVINSGMKDPNNQKSNAESYKIKFDETSGRVSWREILTN